GHLLPPTALSKGTSQRDYLNRALTRIGVSNSHIERSSGTPKPPVKPPFTVSSSALPETGPSDLSCSTTNMFKPSQPKYVLDRTSMPILLMVPMFLSVNVLYRSHLTCLKCPHDRNVPIGRKKV